MMVDAGNMGDAGAILAYLDQLGIQRLKYMVFTHPHEDHIGSDVYKRQDIANAALFLASDMGAYITGQVLSVDGGIIM